MLRGCVDMQPAGHNGTVDVLLFTQFGIHRILDASEF